jgi:hypothetical protein
MEMIGMNRIVLALAAVPAMVVMSTQSAYAYLDPGTASMVLQGLIGGIAGGLFAIRIYWSKLKSRFGRAPASPRVAADQRDDKAN